jgi:hypothetical protein
MRCFSIAISSGRRIGHAVRLFRDGRTTTLTRWFGRRRVARIGLASSRGWRAVTRRLV